MCFPLIFTVHMLFAAVEQGSSHAVPNPPPVHATGSRIGAGASEPPTAVVVVDGSAPDFSYQAFDGRWRHLHDVLNQGSVVLVFGPTEEELRAIEAEREQLLQLGIVPVAVVDARPGHVWSQVRRNGLRYLVLADPRRVIAEQFNLYEPSGPRTLPGWFVIDRSRRVRRLQRGRSGIKPYTELAAQALGLPLPGLALPASK